MATDTLLLLSVGDPPSADSLNINDGSNFAVPRGTAAAVLGQMSQGGPNYGSHIVSGQTSGDPAQPPNTRVISFPIKVACPAGQLDWLSENRRDLDKKLDQARMAWGAYGLGTRVTLSLQRPGHSNPVIFDVAGGMVTYVNSGFLSTTPADVCLLTLYVAPYGRGPSTTTTVSSTLTNWSSSPYYVAGVPGDHDAITRLIVKDVSGSGIIQKLRIGLRAMRPMASSDFTAFYSAAVSSLAGNIGTLTAMAGTRNGTNAVRCTPPASWAPFAQVTGAAGTLDYGVFDVYAKIRDASAVLSAPTSITVTGAGGGGFVAGIVATFQITEVDGSGNETAASAPVYYAIQSGSGNTAYHLTWVASGAPTTYNIYFYYSSAGWNKYSTAATNITITALAASGPPPQTAAVVYFPAQIQAFAMVNGTNQSLASVPGRVAVSQVSNSIWELVYLGTFRLPPQVHQEAAGELNWLLQFQIQNTGSMANYDLDCIMLAPHDYPASYIEVTAPNGALAAKADWYIDCRWDGRVSAKLLAASDHTTLVGAADVSGEFNLRPGDNLVIVEADQYGSGAFQPIMASQFTVQAVYEPRYSFDRGIS